MMMIKVRNPNPKHLMIMQLRPDVEPRTLLTLKTHEEATVLFDTGLRLSYAGRRAIAVMEAEGGAWDGEQWAQEVVEDLVAPDPEKALAQDGASA